MATVLFCFVVVIVILVSRGVLIIVVLYNMYAQCDPTVAELDQNLPHIAVTTWKGAVSMEMYIHMCLCMCK